MVNTTLMDNIRPVSRATRSVIINLHNMHLCQVRQTRQRFRMSNHCCTLILITRTTLFSNNVGRIILLHRLPLGQIQHNRMVTPCTPMSHQPCLFRHICPPKPIIIIYHLSTHILITNHKHHILDIRTTSLRGTSNLFLIRLLLVSDTYRPSIEDVIHVIIGNINKVYVSTFFFFTAAFRT